jgi:hypothetical protein
MALKRVFILAKQPLKITMEDEKDYIKIRAEGKEVWCGDTYHTLEELYKHRYALFIALCKIYDNYLTPLSSRVKCWKSKLHSNGTMFEDSFVLGMTITEFTGPESQITYHLPLEYWNKINVIELSHAPPYDVHDSNDILERLMKL